MAEHGRPPAPVSISQRRLFVLLAVLVGVVGIALLIASIGGDDPPPSSTLPNATASDPTSTPPNSVTIATTPAQTSTTVEPTTTTVPTLELRPEGLGDLTFGDDAELAVRVLSQTLGPPTSDTGWQYQLEVYGTCIGTEVRFVQWGSLQIFLTDGPSEWAPAGVRHIAHWAESIELGTPLIRAETKEGVSVGSQVDEIIGAYGTEAEITDDPLYGPIFMLDTSGAGFLLGALTGLSSSDTLISLSAGFACGE